MAKILFLVDMVRPHSNGLLIGGEFARQGHLVGFFDREYGLENFKKAFAKFEPDLIFDASGLFCLDHVEWAHREGVKIVSWYPDAYFLYTDLHRDKILRLLETCDLFFTTMKGHVADSPSDKVVWIPHFFSNTYYVRTIDRPTGDNFPYDVTFIGTAHPASPQRTQYIDALKKTRLRLLLRGDPFGRGNYRGDVVADAYNQSKIGLNIASGGILAKELQFSVRVFHVMGCGAMLLCEEVEGIEQLFIPGEHLVMYSGEADMVAKARYFSEHHEERERIAREGKALIFEKHLISHRVKQFLQEFKNRGLT